MCEIIYPLPRYREDGTQRTALERIEPWRNAGMGTGDRVEVRRVGRGPVHNFMLDANRVPSFYAVCRCGLDNTPGSV